MNTTVAQVVGGNLFEIAARYLGSPLQWVNLAQANEISDPFLIGVQFLTLPATNEAFGDGTSPQ